MRQAGEEIGIAGTPLWLYNKAIFILSAIAGQGARQNELGVAEVVRVKHKPNVADAITASRIVFAIFLLPCPTFSAPFYAFYLLGAFTDMIDGTTARMLNLKSSFGAKLDTAADAVFVAAVLAKVFPAIDLPCWLWIWIAMIALIKLINLVSSLVMFHRIIPVHTALNKVTGFILFLLPFSIESSKQVMAVAVIAACAIATLAAIQEGHLARAGKDIE